MNVVSSDRRGFIMGLISGMKELSAELISSVESFERFGLVPDAAWE